MTDDGKGRDDAGVPPALGEPAFDRSDAIVREAYEPRLPDVQAFPLFVPAPEKCPEKEGGAQEGPGGEKPEGQTAVR